MKRTAAFLISWFLCALGPLGACTDPIEIKNARPQLTWLAAQPAADGVVKLTLWVADLDGDSVDVTADVLMGDQTIALKQAPGSYGLLGLTTRDAEVRRDGQPHEILWDTQAVNGQVTLRLTPNDRPHDDDGVGLTALSPSFDIAVGLPEPAPLTSR